MLETCNSCGTVFDVDTSTLSKNIQWLKCSVCNEKWSISSKIYQNFDKNKIKNDKNSLATQIIFKDKSEQVKHELASIKSVVEDKTKYMSKKTNPVFDQKNKSVAEIASELSASKLSKNNSTKVKNKNKSSQTTKKQSFIPLIFLVILALFSAVLFFRSTLLSYSFFYFPKYTINFETKINEFFYYIKLPITVELNDLNIKNFVAVFQEEKVNLSGVIKNKSSIPILVPRINILAVREDRKIILDKILVLKEKIILPLSEIKFSKVLDMEPNKDNISVKATLLKKVYDR